jgi:hypothetical protein
MGASTRARDAGWMWPISRGNPHAMPLKAHPTGVVCEPLTLKYTRNVPPCAATR